MKKITKFKLIVIILLFNVFIAGCNYIEKGKFTASKSELSNIYLEPRNIEYIRLYEFNNSEGYINTLEFWLSNPIDCDSQVNVTFLDSSGSYSHEHIKPKEYDIDYYKFINVPKNTNIQIKQKFKSTNYKIDCSGIIIDEIKDYNLSSALYRKYTMPEKYIESNDKQIINKSKEITSNETNPYKKAKLIYNWTIEHIDYDLNNTINEYKGAKFAFDNKIGLCTEYSCLFVALCRASGIPSRVIAGWCYPIREKKWIGHAWAEVYIENYGWIPVDPTFGDDDFENREYYFGKTEHRIISSNDVNFSLLGFARNNNLLVFSDIGITGQVKFDKIGTFRENFSIYSNDI